jgi:ribosomal protein L37AE/L43A
MRSTFAAAHATESSPFTCAALPMVFPEWRGYCVWSEARCPMVCPRCDRARIERDGAVIRCAVCGMSYDPSPEITTHLVEKGAALPHWVAAAAFVPERRAASHAAGYLDS